MHKQQTKQFFAQLAYGTILLASLIATPSTALESDKEQELVWSADGDSRMRTDGGTRFVEMSNNVKISQGSLKVSGNEAIIEYNIADNEVIKVTVMGSPVHYQQQLDSNEELVHGSSRSISFYTEEDDGSTIVELIGEAVVISPNSNIKCSSIIYIADQDLIREAPGPCTGVFNSVNQ
jgi:lipopolysaccharide transport protein LptA